MRKATERMEGVRRDGLFARIADGFVVGGRRQRIGHVSLGLTKAASAIGVSLRNLTGTARRIWPGS